ncbi:MAG: adenylate/guanylate cyclase domain-containing protein [Spirochaetota bacterium]
MKKNHSLSKRILHIFFKQNKLISEMNGIREVYFGLRSRVLGLVVLVMIITISILTLIMYLNNRELIEEEKNTKAISLTQILSGPAEFYLDRDIETTKDEVQTKYNIIQRESQNFITYNDDIVKIVLADESGRIRFSTQKQDYERKNILPYIKKGLQQNEDKLLSSDFSIETSNRKTKATETTRLRAITYPVFLKTGDVVSILNDFTRLYDEYHSAGKPRKNQIYLYLWKKYKDILDKDFDPAKNRQEQGIPAKVTKAHDIDFVFYHLFNYCMTFRKKFIPANESALWDSKWLFAQKDKKLKAYLEDSSAKAKDIDDAIISRISTLSERVEKSRRLGVIAVVFNIDIIKQSSARNISQIIKIALIILALSIVAIFFVLNYNVKNLKKLERWAIDVSKGNLDEKIHIATNDEIGRLGDITNYMIDEIKVKYHLEKFVSKSTKSMIEKQKSEAGELDLGVTGRNNFAFIFSDVRGFTSFSEKEDPGTVVEVLNFYLELQSKIVKSNKGDIDDYVGDQIMAHFSGEKRADRAIETGIKIMKEIVAVNAERKKAGLPVFEVGIGVHGGDVVVGNIGSKFRMDFTSVGDTVNLTSRLCSAADPGEILVSQDLFQMTKKKFKKIDCSPIDVKGKEKKVKIVKIVY